MKSELTVEVTKLDVFGFTIIRNSEISHHFQVFKFYSTFAARFASAKLKGVFEHTYEKIK